MEKTKHYPNGDNNLAIQVDRNTNPATLITLNWAKWLALGAVAGPVLFTLAWFVLGFVSPGFTIWGTKVSHYSPISQSISGLGLGPTALYMNAAFVLSGLLVIAGAVGIFQSIREMGSAVRWSCTVLLALSGLGMVVDGIFTLESILPHTVGFLLGNGTPVLSFLVLGLVLRHIPRWRRFDSWLLLGSPLTLALLVLYFATFDPIASGEGLGIAGLTQRILVTEVLVWIAVMGWKAFRQP